MKKIAILSPFLFLSIVLYGQIPTANSYIPNNYINKFEGVWFWHAGPDTVKIALKKIPIKLIQPVNSYREVLAGCHSYIIKGDIVESSMSKYDSLIKYNREELATLLVYHTEGLDTSKLKGTIRDITKNKNINLTIELLSDIPLRIKVKLIPVSATNYNIPGDPSPFVSGFTLPEEMILSKQ